MHFVRGEFTNVWHIFGTGMNDGVFGTFKVQSSLNAGFKFHAINKFIPITRTFNADQHQQPSKYPTIIVKLVISNGK